MAVWLARRAAPHLFLGLTRMISSGQLQLTRHFYHGRVLNKANKRKTMSSLFAASSMINNAQVRGARDASNQASRAAADVRLQNKSIQADIEKLFMITEALWIILKEEHGYTEETLHQLIHDIDMQDGRQDGKVAKQQNPSCPQCGRTLIGKQTTCIYCGTAVTRDPFER